jgi:ABC-type cobalamin/Fe3+-siderophores transport system ATPase subunit
VVVATHNPQALEYATRAVLLRDGRVEAEGAPAEMRARLSTD